MSAKLRRAIFITGLLGACDGASIVGGIPALPADGGRVDAGDGAPSGDLPQVPVDAAPRDAASDGAPDDLGADVALLDLGADLPTASDVVAGDRPAADVVFVPDVANDTVASVDTVLMPQITAGRAIVATCLARNAAGDLLLEPQSRFTLRASPENLVRNDSGTLVASRPGVVRIACVHRASNIADESPTELTIVAGSAVVSRVTVTPAALTAGESATVNCTYFDSEENPVPPPPEAATVSLLPARGTRVNGNRVQFERTGIVEARCVLLGLTALPGMVRVNPAGAVALRIDRAPGDRLYENGALILFEGVALDRFGNQVPGVPVTWTVPPQAVMDNGRPTHLRFTIEGDYVVRARATGEGGRPLDAEVRFRVDSIGPRLRCVSPASPSMLDMRPGTTITVSGTAADPFGIESVRVRSQGASDYIDVPVDSAGRWSATIPAARFGMNYLSVGSSDRNGISSVELCSYLVAERWYPERTPLRGSIGFSMTQAAVDDGAPATPITSVNDLLQTVIAGPALSAQINAALTQANPVLNNPCAVSFFGLCISARIDVVSVQLNGPNQSSVTLVDGGIRLGVIARNIVVPIRVESTLGNFTGRMQLSQMAVNATFDVRVVSGRIRATLRPGTASVNVPTPSITLDGLPSEINALVNGAVASTLPPLLGSSLQTLVVSQMGTVLDGIFSSFDVRALSSTFSIGANGANTRSINLLNTIDAVEITSQRLRLVLASLASGPTERTTPSLGIPLASLSDTEPAQTSPVAVTLNIGLFNQIFHAMWRTGALDTNTPTTLLGSPGELRIRFELPPVAHRSSTGDLVVDLGGVELITTTLDPPVTVRFGVRLRSRPTVEGTAIRFGAFEIVELYSAPIGVPINSTWNDNAQRQLLPFVQTFTGDALGRSLPTIPAPSFVVPNEFTMFGLPRGTELGLRNPSFTTAGQLFIIQGAFGQISP